jgi:thiamine-phosphate pyrophosphorylase
MLPVLRLAEARLYLVTDIAPGGRSLDVVLRAALRGGVDLVQLRDKTAGDDALLAAAAIARAACDEAGALFIVNDRPDLALAAGADGVHVGQDDLPVGAAREVLGPDAIVGLSTHTPDQIDDAHGAHEEQPDYIAVGPVHATPTKPGRPAVGLELVSYAARTAAHPWFAIGGIDPANVAAVTDAGAARIVVVRAIAEADDPRSAASTLRAALDAPLGVSHG